MKILDYRQIRQKTKRLAYEILENNYHEQEIILAGINNAGMIFAQRLFEELTAIKLTPIRLIRIRLFPADPLSQPVHIELPPKELKNKVVVIVDDVANTGRTIFYACKPLLETLPKKIEVAVLVDRKHKSFPVKVDYVGISLATTLKEDIDVQLSNSEADAVYLN